MLELLLGPDLATFNRLLLAWGVIGILSALGIHFVGLMPKGSRGPLRRPARPGTIDKRLGRILIELLILITVIGFYLATDEPPNASIVFIGVFVFHYMNRALIYPSRLQLQGKRIPLSVLLPSLLFYVINGYLVGYYFGALRQYPVEWLWDPRFITGMAMFVIGLLINVHAEHILINLRRPGEGSYKIPRGGLFRRLSCPNYFGEILEWVGFAIMSWSLMGVVYALWVALPLIAQALRVHRWYQQQFGEAYPARRRAVIPYLL